MGKILFIIPARSGSKGITNKNIKLCAGETLLRRAVKICQEIDCDKRIVISTDNRKYLDHIDDLGDFNDFLRPEYLSGDNIGDVEVLINALHSSEVIYKESYSCISMIQPTSPLRKPSHILDTINAVINENWSSSLTAHKVDLKYHPLKALKRDSDGSASFFIKEGSNIISRQQLSSTYVRNGASYAVDPIYLCTKKNLIGDHTKIIETEPMISIDNLEELKYCERKLKGQEKIFY